MKYTAKDLLKYTNDLAEEKPNESAYWHLQKLKSKMEEALTIPVVRKRCFSCDSLNIKHLETYNECQDCKSIM